jgi:hypothetical protein
LSHITKIELKIKDLECLKQACETLGFEFRENQKNYAWYGRWVGNQPLPEEISEDELGTCDHAIHVPGCQFEVGVLKKGRHYILLWDTWVKGKLTNALGKDAGILKQAYTVATVKKAARKKQYRITETKTETGIRLTLSA